MAEGFLHSDKKSVKMEEVGEEYFDDLVSRSMFQKSNQNEVMFNMHDLVHDLALFVSRGFIFSLDDNNELRINVLLGISHIAASLQNLGVYVMQSICAPLLDHKNSVYVACLKNVC